MSHQIPWQLLLFPGVILHEFSHYLACILVGVKVRDVKFWSRTEAFVAHDQPATWKSVVITASPFLIGNFLALEILSMANELFYTFSLLSLLYFWLAISFVYFSFPSRADASNSFNSFISFYKIHILEKGSIFSRLFWLLSFPFLFIPFIFLLGVILIFDSSEAMRWIWSIAVLLFSVQPSLIYLLSHFVNYFLVKIAQIFI